MGEDYSGVNFLKNIKELAEFCNENGEPNLFTKFVASIPVDNTENAKKKKTGGEEEKENDEGINTENTRTFNTKHDHHHDDRGTQRDKSVGIDDTARGSQKKISNNKEKNTNSKAKQCDFCTNRRVRIEDHYFAKHKLDIHKFKRNLQERDSQGNDTTCPQCNDDFRNNSELTKHLIEYHNIHFPGVRSLKKLLKKKNADKYTANGNAAAVRDRKPMGSNLATQEAMETNENDPDAQEERAMQTDAAAEARETTPTSNTQFKHSVLIHEVKQHCDQCKKYVDVSSFEKHMEMHEMERAQYAFKTKRDSTQSVTNRQGQGDRETGSSSNSNETVTNVASREQGGDVVSNNGATGQSEARVPRNRDCCIENEDRPVTQNSEGNENSGVTFSGRDDANGSRDVSEEQDKLAEGNEERMPARRDENEKCHIRKMLWKEYFEKMKSQNLEAHWKIYDEFLMQYALVARVGQYFNYL